MKRRRIAAAFAVTAALVGGWKALDNNDSVNVSAAAPAVAPQVRASLAELLDKAKVVESLPRVAGYERSCSTGKHCVFGPAWNDPLDHSGCDTRQRILRAQLVETTFKPGTKECKILTGLLHDPYSATEIRYSATDPTAIEIDHVAALSRVWNLGAAHWTSRQRAIFANDTDNLLAVSGPLNTMKSDAGIDGWLPPNRSFVCNYIQIYVYVLVKYDLPITRGDRDVAQRQCMRS